MLDEATARAFGRIESTLDRISAQQIEVLTTLARHDERLRLVEGEVRELKANDVHKSRHGMTFRSGLLLTLTGPIVSVLINWVFTLTR